MPRPHPAREVANLHIGHSGLFLQPQNHPGSTDKKRVNISKLVLIGAGLLAVTVLTAMRMEAPKASDAASVATPDAPPPVDSWRPVGDSWDLPPALEARTPASPEPAPPPAGYRGFRQMSETK